VLERYRRERGFMNHHAAKVALALLANDFLRKRVVRPGGFELPTFWFVAGQGQNPNGLFGVAYEF
jgi:hypothetical protein